jgi:glycolate oxidase FAD binding subunit
MSSFKGISLYEPEELVLEAGAGTSLVDIEKELAKNNQQLAFEPPDYSRMLGAKHKGTLGGLMGCGLSGPRRIKAGAARDHILGIAGVSGRGEIFKAGGRVVKNVTGLISPSGRPWLWRTSLR